MPNSVTVPAMRIDAYPKSAFFFACTFYSEDLTIVDNHVASRGITTTEANATHYLKKSRVGVIAVRRLNFYKHAVDCTTPFKARP